jgi:hypothetical protein
MRTLDEKIDFVSGDFFNLVSQRLRALKLRSLFVQRNLLDRTFSSIGRLDRVRSIALTKTVCSAG